ncbi:DELLA protein RGA [Quillaja saponaria]|uniref:DELLA protein RGA n=1 Tax=Quillaja saponaria TaxID=32244 RepID=A0AAD7LUF2_QUISA|nr:DELLA protein RGA [Quillaja saponaria]
MKRDHQESYGGSGYGGSSGSVGKAECSSMSTGKAKMWDNEQDAGGMDELLAVLGYKVRSSDMADVAQKLEQLEMISLVGFRACFLSSTNSPTNLNDPVLAPAESSTIPRRQIENQSRIYNDDSEYDLRAIPGVAAYPPNEPTSETENSRKRLKISIGSNSSPSAIGESAWDRDRANVKFVTVGDRRISRDCDRANTASCPG